MHFNLTDDCIDSIIAPFMAGQYSKINKDFKDMHFSKTYIPSKVDDLGKIHSVVWKRPHYKKLLTDSLGIDYTAIEELDSIPLFQDEIMGYKENRPYEDNSSLIENNEAFIALCNTLEWDIKETGINEILDNADKIRIGL
jgi:hypothetical protein